MQYTTVLLLALGVAVAADPVKWSVKNTANKTCLIFAAETITAKLNIQNPENVTESISFAINATTKIEGDCNGNYKDEPANILVVSFFPDGAVPQHATDGQPWRLFFWFTAPTDKSSSFKLADYKLETSPGSLFNSTTQNFTKSATADFDVRASGTNAFKCSTTGLSLASDVAGTADSTLEVKDARVIAFAVLETTDFPAEQTFEQCQLDARTSDIVPIVVGACLAGLVAVVLVAYLVGRARAKRQGYASV